MVSSVRLKVGSGFCPFLCVRRLAECDASLVVKATSTMLRFPLESSTCVVLFLSPQNLSGFAGTPLRGAFSAARGGCFKKLLSPITTSQNLGGFSPSIWGVLPRWGYYPTVLRTSRKPPATPRHRGHRQGITAVEMERRMQQCKDAMGESALLQSSFTAETKTSIYRSSW